VRTRPFHRACSPPDRAKQRPDMGGVRVRDLSIGEMATVVGLHPAPELIDAEGHGETALRVRGGLLQWLSSPSGASFSRIVQLQAQSQNVFWSASKPARDVGISAFSASEQCSENRRDAPGQSTEMHHRAMKWHAAAATLSVARVFRSKKSALIE
jgi:hypothetical protein